MVGRMRLRKANFCCFLAGLRQAALSALVDPHAKVIVRAE
jgi:hypothetical protein